MKPEKYCVNETYTIKEVLQQLEQTQDRCVIVTSSAGKVIGVLSQGDIIRALLRGKNIYSSIHDVLNPSFLHLYENNLKRAYKVFKKYKISILPVISKENDLINVITLGDIFQYLENPDSQGGLKPNETQ